MRSQPRQGGGPFGRGRANRVCIDGFASHLLDRRDGDLALLLSRSDVCVEEGQAFGGLVLGCEWGRPREENHPRRPLSVRDPLGEKEFS